MYGPRSSYDSKTIAEMDQRIEDAAFVRNLLHALKHPKVLQVVKDIITKEVILSEHLKH
jgi:hypothetical protein